MTTQWAVVFCAVAVTVSIVYAVTLIYMALMKSLIKLDEWMEEFDEDYHWEKPKNPKLN